MVDTSMLIAGASRSMRVVDWPQNSSPNGPEITADSERSSG